MSSPTVHVDVLIFGGGIAGLWTLARLRREGYSCILLESKALGSGQTIASQGIIHGGIKYALTGKASAASKAIAEMPGIWRACLRGEGEVDLRQAKVLSEQQYLWTTAGIGSRLVGVAASKAIRTAVEPVARDARPREFAGAPGGVDVYTVEEPVLDPHSLVAALAGGIDAPMLGVDSGDITLTRADGGSGLIVRLERTGRSANIHAKCAVLAAGSGNEQLATAIGAGGGEPIHHQRRPLHMVLARGDLPVLFGHCVGMSDKPRITITSQRDADGRMIWYIGGQISESGVERESGEQIDAAKREVGACVPWVDLGGAQWSSFRVDRAEGVIGERAGDRPDEPVVGVQGGAIIAYPTKLAFAPLLAERVAAAARKLGIQPSAADLGALADWPRATVAELPWSRSEVQWT